MTRCQACSQEAGKNAYECSLCRAVMFHPADLMVHENERGRMFRLNSIWERWSYSPIGKRIYPFVLGLALALFVVIVSAIFIMVAVLLCILFIKKGWVS